MPSAKPAAKPPSSPAEHSISPKLLRMFKKVDLNGDHLLDLNECEAAIRTQRAPRRCSAAAPECS